ncbi:hypothetical protein [uncultured Arcobacter sp.]|uniref:hypothetical protein n=1 Tax=uncultured Arcobacter sp. TaxID=165434 RepID=UPI0026189B0F|nr:hypothetical protein [uncultured Arcobacter sp.]
MKNKLGLSLNIYIYGGQNFKKDIKDELNRTHIDFKLGDNGLIQDVQSLNTLKELIEDNDDDVFLIDDAKIIKENLINSKIKFLKPKDGIEQEYLKQKGIDDLSVDSIADISKYILKKMKDLGLDDDDDFDDRQIQDSITNIVNDAYNSEDKDTVENEDKIIDDDYELSDDLKDLLSQDEETDYDDAIDEDSEKIEIGEEELQENEEESFETNESEQLLDEESKINTNDETDKTFESITSLEEMDELMSFEDITSLDDLTEDDILSALSGKDIKPRVAKKIENKAKEMSLKLDNPNDIKEFLTKLLESKALEITVKIKE